MAFYEFTREDVTKVRSDPRFLRGVQLAVEEGFAPSPVWFRGDPELLKKCEGASRSEIWELVKEYPLPYISLCEDPEAYEGENRKRVMVDVDTRNTLLNQAKDKDEMAWWTYVHCCNLQAVFITYPMLRLLYPTQNFFLYPSDAHVVILNQHPDHYTKLSNVHRTRDLTEPCIFDPIGLCTGEDYDFAMTPSYRGKVVIQSPDLIDWYAENYGYVGLDTKPMKEWFQTLP